MNVLLLPGLLFIFSFFQTNLTYKAADLRNVYFKAANEQQAYEQLAPHLAKYKGNDVLIQGFQAGIEGVGAKYASGLYAKIKHVRKSAQDFEKVISKDPYNPEVRFLRYTIEYHIPRYLLMSGHLQEDKKVIFKSLLNYPDSGIEPDAFKIMRDYFLRGNHSTADEKQKLRNLKV
ncbi:hypothetical protein [Adhaeribacter pallidiroseus]|uniref:Uncharacterized protein n=1 Tax=Adhaeribacter pallidiroseus TaxID=2072847 RepID=A0A369QIV8_9BACT|nr:hypothetical protein [Adhaeribacter pallidiroseus]RDC62228.1 hypothetical protein AHMF7616_00819 [Adhaeribacter pallidiroseus]